MVRGHAEALMPLIARVMERGRARLRRARPHRGHHRARQLHRPARRHRRRARHRARRRQAGGRPYDARRLRRALDRRRRYAAGGRRRSMRATITSICRCSGRAAAPSWRRGWRRLREALRAAATGAPRLVGTAADLLAAAWPAGERRRASSMRAARPTSTGWRGSAPPPRDRRAAQAALPARARRPAAGRRATGAPMMGLLRPSVRARRAGAVGGGEPRRRGDRRAACRLVRRGWSEEEVESLLLDRHVIAHRAMTGASSPASSCRGWSRTRRKSSRSRWHARRRGRGLARKLLDLHCAGWRAWARARCSWRSTSTIRRRSGFTTAPAFARCPAAPTIIRAPRASRPPPWYCAAIWFNA